MAFSLEMRADRAILKRQKAEFKQETMVAQGIDQFKVEQKGLWENRMADVIRTNRVKGKMATIKTQQRATLQERRQRLAKMLSQEQSEYEQEMIDREETPQQRMDKMAVRAYELKKRREDERKAFVQEKLYQQWREGIDELRTMDSKIVELKTIAGRDFQLDEKQMRREEEKSHDDFYDKLWHEGYLAKIEREEREKKIKEERNDQQTATLAVQLEMKTEQRQDDKEKENREAHEMKKLWAIQEQEEKDALVREKIIARRERAKADEYMVIQQSQREEETRMEKQSDREFVDGVLDRERKLSEMEERERIKAKKKAVEYTEALKIEMAKKAASEEALIKMQQEESERQWDKRYEKWEKEELARRDLMREVYTDRAEQVKMKHGMREALKHETEVEKDLLNHEVHRLESIEQERAKGEKLVAHRHQEELFRQMDFHQVQRHRDLQQHAIEQRQAAIAEEKIRRAVKAEKNNATNIMKEVMHKRATQRSTGSLAPWEK
eukprot:TRINITY_DN1516_c0_g1_i1.p1 TRINITY_DN1516_c0_g1~~TRINITY_DN1516_c0_g1_i1.p1  ORF type:complete len:496 (-),score=173.38 TRINITY_DN1516_c0_g1_i1:76-1563(-)